MSITEKELLIDTMEAQLHRAWMMNHISRSTENPWNRINQIIVYDTWDRWWKIYSIDHPDVKESHAFRKWCEDYIYIRNLI
jgi:hypothetical protein